MLAKLKTGRADWDIDNSLRTVLTKHKALLSSELASYDKIMLLTQKTNTQVDEKYKILHNI